MAPGVIMLFLAAMQGCDAALSALDRTPDRIEFVAPSGAVLDVAGPVLGAQVVTKRGRPLTDVVISYAVTPVEVARADASGAVTCLRSGDAAITMSGGGLSTNAVVKCRPVGRVTAPKQIALIAGNDPKPLEVEVLDIEGKPLRDVVPSVSTDAAEVATFRDGRVVPMGLGQATLRVQAGTKETSVAVAVIERVDTKTLALSDGESLTFTLLQGRYVVESKVRASDGSNHGVTYAWVGADSCGNQSEATHHVFDCRVENTASLVVQNPTSWGLGPAETGNVSIYRVPEDFDVSTARGE